MIHGHRLNSNEFDLEVVLQNIGQFKDKTDDERRNILTNIVNITHFTVKYTQETNQTKRHLLNSSHGK